MKLKDLLEVHIGAVIICSNDGKYTKIVNKQHVGDIKYKTIAKYLDNNIVGTQSMILDYYEKESTEQGIVEEVNCEPYGVLIIEVEE